MKPIRLIDFFDKSTANHPERPLLVEERRNITYRSAQAISRRIANALHRDGFAVGTKIAILSRNSIEACLSAIGILRAGCVWASFDPNDPPESISATLERLDVEGLFYSTRYADTVGEIRSLCPGLRAMVCLDGSGRHSLEAWLADVGDGLNDFTYTGDELVTLFATGGTTGIPKGVMATHRNWLAGFGTNLMRYPHDGTVEGLLMPISHNNGGSTLLFGMSKGSTLVIFSEFDPEHVMETIQERRITTIFVPTTGISIMLSHPKVGDYDYSSLWGINYGGAHTSLILEAMDVFGPVLTQGFAQTETLVGVAALTQLDHIQAKVRNDFGKLDSCGRMLPMSWVEAMKNDGTIQSRGEIGELVVRCGSMMEGYYKAPEETKNASRFGWHHTSDVGYVDEQGYVFLLDRQRDMIKTRGYMVFPGEIEKVILSHFEVLECAVVGVPDSVLGEAIKAIVVARDGYEIQINDLIMSCKKKLGAQKTPISVEIWRDLPKNRAGKILRREVRNQYWPSSGKKI